MPLVILRASLVVRLVKNLPAMGETWVQSLYWEDRIIGHDWATFTVISKTATNI